MIAGIRLGIRVGEPPKGAVVFLDGTVS